MNQVTKDALGISSGTIASLIGDTRYSEIDKVQSAFVLFCNSHAGEFESWIKAWHAFAAENQDLIKSQ